MKYNFHNTDARLTEEVYNCLDGLATARIFDEMNVEDHGRSGFKFDSATLGPALTMGLRGIRVDHKKIKEGKEETEEKALELQKQFQEIVGDWKWGRSLKPAPVTFARLLYTKMKVRPHYNKDGGFTIDKEAVTKILEDQRTPEDAWELVNLAQQLETLEEDRKVLNKPLSSDGRMHCTYGIAATTSGRWSSKKTHFDEGANLHALSKHLHKIFVPDDGYVMVNIDQKQGESKIVAYLAGSQSYKDAHFKGNLHVNTGMRLFPDIVYDKKSAQDTKLPWDFHKSYYDLSKRVSHASNYCQSPWGMARHIKVKVAVAELLQEKYFQAFPEIRQWHQEVLNQLRVYHYLTTPFGRVRHFLGRTWEPSIIKEGTAFVPQSTCSQINKIVLWRIWNYFDTERAQVLHECHDSVLFQIRENDTETMQEIMERIKFDVPIRGDILQPVYEANYGHSWSEDEMNPWEGKF